MTGTVGLITGTGLYELEGVEDRRVESVATRYGAAEVVTGRLAGVPVAHVARHGPGHARLSHQVTPRATVAAMVEVGAACLVSTTVCGALDPSLELGSLVVFDRPPLQPPRRRLALHAVHLAGDPGAGPGSTTARSASGPAPPSSRGGTPAGGA